MSRTAIGFGLAALIGIAAYAASGDDSGGVTLSPATPRAAQPNAAPDVTNPVSGMFPALTAGAAADGPATAAVAPDFSQVIAAINASPVLNVAVVVGNANGELFAYNKGSFTVDKVTDIASASKWLTGTLVMRLAQASKLSLNDNPQQKLNYWTMSPGDGRSTITVAQLMSMRSGFNAGPLMGGCVSSILYTLQSCAQNIYNMNTTSAPGSSFAYGPHHIQVAAAYAEKAGGASFNSLFASYVTTPLGMTVTKFAKASANNPWAAGGGQSSARDYAKLLRAMLGNTFIADMDGFTQSRTTGLPVIYAPGSATSGGDWRYAIGSWTECDQPDYATGNCAALKRNSSPGAYGFTPWVDRKHGYYGVIAMNRLAGDDDGVLLERQIQPLIVQALGQ